MTTRSVSAHLEVSAEGDTEIELQVALARSSGLEVTDELTILHEGTEVPFESFPAAHDGVQHLVRLPEGVSTISYSGTAIGRAEVPTSTPLDLSLYRRPSRYATSDTFGGFAASEFGHLEDDALLSTISAWVGTRLQYAPGSSGPTDGASETLLTGAGVCRDYAHLVIALLRALCIPARMTAVYAPGCDPMDFHAVVEAYLPQGGPPGWYAVDATALAPREALVRIATGRDATDTAFMSTVRGNALLLACEVSAVADDGLPDDDLYRAVQIS